MSDMFLGLKNNLISLNLLDANGFRCSYEGGVMKITKGMPILVRGIMVGVLYVLQGSIVTGSTNVFTFAMMNYNTKLCHLRPGHMSEHEMNELSKQRMFDWKRFGTISFCEQCVYGKYRRVSFKPAVHNTMGILDYIHSNLYVNLGRFLWVNMITYLLSFIDEFSRKVWCYFIRSKDDLRMK